MNGLNLRLRTPADYAVEAPKSETEVANIMENEVIRLFTNMSRLQTKGRWIDKVTTTVIIAIMVVDYKKHRFGLL